MIGSSSMWCSCIACVLVGFGMGKLSGNMIPTSQDVGVQRMAEEVEHYKGKDSEGEQDTEAVIFSTAIAIVLLMIFLTIGFEAAKHYLEHKASKSTEPIVEKLWAELTVLGFLSVFTFVVAKTGVFEIVNDALFGEDAKEEVLELFEGVHYTLFVIMLAFIVQVIVLVREAMQIQEQWLELDKKCRENGTEWEDLVRQYNNMAKNRFRSSHTALSLLPGIRNTQRQAGADVLLFKGLRDEFILERSQDYPFESHNQNFELLQPDFNFGRYLGICLGHTLTHVVEVTNYTWSFYAVVAVMYYLYSLLVGMHIEVLAWTWVAAAWSFFAFNLYFEFHLLHLRQAFVRKGLVELMSASKEDKDPAETTPFLPGPTKRNGSANGCIEDDRDMPAWCDVDLDKYMASRSWFARWLVRGVPTRQQTLYWLDRKGPVLYLHILQINLIFVGVYGAMQILSFLPAMYGMYPSFAFATYCVLAAIPVLLIILFKKHLLATLSQVCCMGMYRRPDAVSDVLREEKTAQAVRTFIVIYKMRRFAEQPVLPSRPHNRKKLHYVESFSNLEIKEVGKTFEAFDSSGDGNISYDEFIALMSSLGGNQQSNEQLQSVYQMLDDDNNGEISKHEFLQWYSENMAEDDVPMKERAEFLFNMFDINHLGELTIEEFKRKLDALHVGFTIDEVGAIVNELDEDKNGTIGLHEFEELLEKYYPKELSGSHR